MRITPGVEQACSEKYEQAKPPNPGYIYCSGLDEYTFANDEFRARGLEVFDFVKPAGSEEAITTLDIGAAHGTWLAKATRRYRQRPIKPIGLAAFDERIVPHDDITWVFGDFQRPDTWDPDNVLQPESVDLAVSYLTFRHFANPLRAFQVAANLLKPNGHLFVEGAYIDARIGDASDIAAIVGKDLGQGDGIGGGYSTDQFTDELITISLHGVHLERSKGFPEFAGVEPYIHETGAVAYRIS